MAQVVWTARSKEFSQDFGARVRRHRLKMKPFVSQEALAHRAGLDRSFVGHIEQGRGSPTLDSIVRIAAALGVDPCSLVRGMKP